MMKRLLFTSTLSFLIISALASPTSDGRGLNTLTTSSDVDDLRGLHGVDFRQANKSPMNISTKEPKKTIQFSKRTGRNVELSNNLRTARRINADEDFEGGVAITNRALDNEEMFEVLLDKFTSLWLGSIKIGVTQNSSDNFDFGLDCDMPRCGVWSYMDFITLKVGDRIGVMKHQNGSLDVIINGIFHTSYEDVPETVYGIVELYGNAEQATIQLPT